MNRAEKLRQLRARDRKRKDCAEVRRALGENAPQRQNKPAWSLWTIAVQATRNDVQMVPDRGEA